MKNLSNCKPTEFFKQTVKIRRYVEGWLDSTDILNIRKNMPELNDSMTEDEKNAAITAQAKKNIWDMFDRIFDDNAEKTIGLLALLCFIEPEKADDHEMGEYLQSISELISDERVITFFTSLLMLDRKSISVLPKA